jgi:hypothetical protein
MENMSYTNLHCILASRSVKPFYDRRTFCELGTGVRFFCRFGYVMCKEINITTLSYCMWIPISVKFLLDAFAIFHGTFKSVKHSAWKLKFLFFFPQNVCFVCFR